MYIKIYFGDKPLFLCDDIDSVIQPFAHHDDAVFIDELNNHTIKAMIHEMQLPKVHAGIFFHTNLDELKKAFFKKFTVIQAGGGLVLNEKKEILMIFRKGKWDLPKGKLDEGEDLATCAIREVEEETGLQRIKIGKLLHVTYHTYHEGSKFILKETHWYLMQVKGPQHLVPQVIEDIHEIKWVSNQAIPTYLPESYPAISDVIHAATKTA
jgi:8-oxo-dGTP pyrophosphatase MutT (NUDIX family)